MRNRRLLGFGIAIVTALSACSATPDDGTTAGAPNGPNAAVDPAADAAASNDAPAAPAPVGPTPDAQPVTTDCTRDDYTEPLPSTGTSLTGLTFSQSKAKDYLLAALGRRYPLGKTLVEGGVASAGTTANCIDAYLKDKSSAGAVLRQAATVVHECGHAFDLGKLSGNVDTFVIRPADLTFACKDGDTTSRRGRTFARSLVKTDAYYATWKACAPGTAGPNCDLYAPIYLNGNPTDSTFQSGDQGYNLLLEEATQYVNSLATALAFSDQYVGVTVTDRDGILTFLWYIERYLAMARTSYPDAYKLLSEDACWRQATLAVWDRGMFYLEATKNLSYLGINDAKLAGFVAEPALLAEIDALRKLECQ